VAWSLCVEVSFYAFPPLWALLMRRQSARTGRALIRGELIALGVLALLSVRRWEPVGRDTGVE
jgi:peptidoglycan/LPS O-acetylase OafA/YrhL